MYFIAPKREHMRRIKTKYAMQFLAAKMAARKLTQIDLAKRFAISQSTLSRQLSGDASMPIPRVTELCRLLELTKAEVDEVNARLIRGHNEYSGKTRGAALETCHRCVDQIGDDVGLMYLLIYWDGMTAEQRVAVLAMANTLADETSRERREAQETLAAHLRAAETPATYGGKKQ